MQLTRASAKSGIASGYSNPVASFAAGLPRRLLGLVIPALTLVAWQVTAMYATIGHAFLPSPAEVLTGWYMWAFGPQSSINWTSGTFFWFCFLSIRRVLLGFLIGSSIGLVVGIVVGWYRLASELLDPMIQATRPIPMTAWLPFATLVFGVQEPAAIFLIAMGCFFPVALNAASGASQTPRLLVRAALMLGTHPHRILLKVVIPSAMPAIVTGVRLALGVAWVLVIVAEILAVRGGLGYAIWGAYQFVRMDLIIAAILTLAVLGWSSDRLLVALADRLLAWQSGLVGQQ